MNINQQEQGVLVTQKVIEGKSHKQAHEEVKRDKDFLRNFDQELREKKKAIKQKQKEFEQLDIKFKKEFKKLKEGKEKKPSETSRQHFATTYHLKRILTYLEEANNFVTTTELKDACCTSSEYIKSGLVFLERFDLVESKRNDKGVQVYKRKY